MCQLNMHLLTLDTREECPGKWDVSHVSFRRCARGQMGARCSLGAFVHSLSIHRACTECLLCAEHTREKTQAFPPGAQSLRGNGSQRRSQSSVVAVTVEEAVRDEQAGWGGRKAQVIGLRDDLQKGGGPALRSTGLPAPAGGRGEGAKESLKAAGL